MVYKEKRKEEEEAEVCVDNEAVVVERSQRLQSVFRTLLQEKERELLYQKVILEGCQEEFSSLKQRLDEEEDPDVRREMMDTARKCAVALQGKKDQFLTVYYQWRRTMVKLNQHILEDDTYARIEGL